ncbi:hypothetical protein NG701_07650 [Pseudarthrobacter sp. HLT3-5]|uniref:putative PDDEXK endonuclease n=1 Tax=Pseudarthrobacter cellobiosi TaxID=2953654 RepID=UPI00208E2C14|nr:hypothetical protein [Pseudarthrobacter sp. HLT3-5]MCO4274303.1 hypothetical protein [Pseudarthrobacter sp. HLT3-5]
MSISSDKGVSLEKEVAKMLQKKLGARVARDSRSGAGPHHKTDIKDYFQDTPLDIECKNHQTIKIKEWFRQAVAGASISRIPTVVFTSDDEVLATVRFSDLVDLVAETQQHRVEIKRLKEPVLMTGAGEIITSADIKAGPSRNEWTECRGGNMVSPGEKKCLVKTCTVCQNKKVKKVKK